MNRWLIKWRDHDFAEFSRMVKIQLQNGIPILYGLKFIKETLPKKLRPDIKQIIYLIEQGESISRSLEQIKFPKSYLSIIRLGEEQGELIKAFEQMEWYYRQKNQLKQTIKSVIAYPLFILVMIQLLFIFLATVLIPQFLQLYRMIQAEIPSSTRKLISSYYFFQNNLWWILLLFAVLLGLFFYLRQKNRFRKNLILLLLKLPFSRRVLLQKYTYLFSFHLGTFLNSGVSFLKGIELLLEYDDPLIKETSFRMKELMLQGNSVSDSMKQELIFLPSFAENLKFYEETGSLDTGLQYISTQLQNQIEHELNQKLKWLEPILLMVSGAFVFLIIYTLFSPLFYLMDSL
ncbi:type II secretion system F family protein [Tepidibacillus sp. HK-1]|uniref:type II secretion system F family protein n=1 Tax=Tepidibacillus sp. HK-1 TaxID=1883407 RepID=UPI000852CD68|nr:type II secretion system F family protein [Tepidibacillus sp. HK-1]GBF10988.1 type II secretion system protein F [Tepidibacillus sp. HK-1]